MTLGCTQRPCDSAAKLISTCSLIGDGQSSPQQVHAAAQLGDSSSVIKKSTVVFCCRLTWPSFKAALKPETSGCENVRSRDLKCLHAHQSHCHHVQLQHLSQRSIMSGCLLSWIACTHVRLTQHNWLALLAGLPSSLLGGGAASKTCSRDRLEACFSTSVRTAPSACQHAEKQGVFHTVSSRLVSVFPTTTTVHKSVTWPATDDDSPLH